LLPAVRDDLVRRMGREDEAIAAYRKALKSVDLEP
jgi:predicted RNA polymerase sigma factor